MPPRWPGTVCAMNPRTVASVVASLGILSIALACSSPTPSPLGPPPAMSGSSTPAPDRGEITTERDDFRQQDVLKARFRLGRGIELTLLTTSGDPVSVGFLFMSFSERWRFLRCHEVLALAGDTPWSMPPFDREGDTRRGGVTESLAAEVPYQALETFATAPRVRFSLCVDEVELNSGQRETLQRYAALRRRMFDPDASMPATDPAGPGRILRCYRSDGTVVPSRAPTCSATGLLDAPPGSAP